MLYSDSWSFFGFQIDVFSSVSHEQINKMYMFLLYNILLGQLPKQSALRSGSSQVFQIMFLT